MVNSVSMAYVGVVAPDGVVFSSTDKLLLAITRSGSPSPFRSPISTALGADPMGNSVWAAYVGVVATGVVVFSSTDTV